jgi:shikimate dehydrogenase
MVEAVAAGSGEVRVLAGPGAVEGPYGLVVNATSLGLDPDDPLPLELDALEAGAAFDLVYGPEGTPWSRQARRRGIPARDGREMLVRQAAASLRRWLGRDPPLSALREALESRSGGAGSSGGGAGG